MWETDTTKTLNHSHLTPKKNKIHIRHQHLAPEPHSHRKSHRNSHRKTRTVKVRLVKQLKSQLYAGQLGDASQLRKGKNSSDPASSQELARRCIGAPF